MPGKKDPEYFPINYNMSGLESFFGIGRTGGSPIVTPCGSLGSHHHGKFEYEPMNMSFNVSIPPVNSEEDEETTDDDEEEETSSMTGSDIDVDMDTLVLSIRKKLKMGVQNNHHHNKNNSSPFSHHHHHHQLHSSRRHSAHKQSSDEFWTDSPVSDHSNHVLIDDEENTSDNVSSSNPGMSSNNIINGSNNNSNSSTSSNNNMRRWRSNVQSINHSHRHNIINGRIQKSHHHHNNHHHHWWTRPNNGKKCSDNTKSASFSLLQELISSGNLISEAVKRLKQKNCFPSISANSNSNSVKLSKKFTYSDPESENNITSCYSTPQITPII